MKIIRIAALLLLATLSAGLAHAEQAIPEELRNSLFGPANEALRSANAAQASLLAPSSYSDAAERYRRAESTLADGGSIDSIQRDLERATTAFNQAAEHSVLAESTFQAALQARQDAISADARTYAPEQWSKAEETFQDAALRLEKGSQKSAKNTADKADEQFRDAELTAIKTNYLNETRTLLDRAKDLRAERYAPNSFATASRLLDEAATELNANRYDTDRPRNLAQQAKHDALHAIYVSRLEGAIRDDDTSLEKILFDWEASLRTLGNLVDTPLHFDNGETQAIEGIAGRITELQADNKRLTGELSDRDAQVEALKGEAQTVERLNQLLAKQERQKERFAKVENLFTESQANVLRKGNSVIVRMIGLNFDVGQATLKPEHYPLLAKLKDAIAEFPESTVVIEGHTDSFGSDALNLELSQRRANAVQQYLLANSPISPASLTALGYGESRPVANNETEAGRTQNRRIDVVIYPPW